MILPFNVLLITAISLSFGSASAQPGPADILPVANVTDAQISPNGQWIVYTVSSVDEDKNFSTLWIVRMAPEPFIATPSESAR